MKKVGLIINPIAGMGGRVGLKGTDGPEILKEAIALGAKPLASQRAKQALTQLKLSSQEFEIIAAPQQMGGQLGQELGLNLSLIDMPLEGESTASDTKNAAEILCSQYELDLLLFVGGDGTARDIYDVVNEKVPVLGIPAGVKIHSGVFAVNPTIGGRLASLFLNGEIDEVTDLEVMDIDEQAFRSGRVTAKLYGYMKVPYAAQMVQGQKASSGITAEDSILGIAEWVCDHMEADTYYFIGPGTTTNAILTEMDLEGTLLGVDVVYNRQLIKKDAGEKDLLFYLSQGPAEIIVTIIGGQGYIFGRGNQQFSPEVLKKLGPAKVQVVATLDKLQALRKALLVDTGDEKLDQEFSGYTRVRTGYGTEAVKKVVAFY